MRWLRDNVTRDGVVTTTDTWLVHQLCGAFVTDSSTASRSLLTDLDSVTWDGELVALFGLDDEELPEIVASDAIVGTTSAFGPDLPVCRSHRRPAGGSAGRGLSGARDGQVHLRHRGLPAGPAGGPRAARSSAGLTTSVAWTLRDADVVLRRRAGLHRRVGRPLGHRPRPGPLGRPAGRGGRWRRRDERGRALRPGSGRAGCALVGCEGDRVVHRHDLEPPARPPGARSAGGDRGPGDGAGRPRRRGPRASPSPGCGSTAG